MSFRMRELQSKSDDELIELHDGVAANTVVGVDYYLDEMRRREMAAAMRSSQRLAFAATILSVVSTAVAVVSLFAR